MTTYVIMLSGITMLLYLTGLDNGNSLLLNTMLNWNNTSNSTLFITIFLAIGSAVGTIVVGFFTKNVDLAFMSAVMPFLYGTLFIPAFIGLIQIMWSVAPVIALIFGTPLLIGFIMLSIDFYRGRD